MTQPSRRIDAVTENRGNPDGHQTRRTDVITTIGRSRLCAWLLVWLIAAPTDTMAQSGGGGAAPPPGTTAAFTPEELDQVAAPIALYPDPLVAQVLMASTYP